MTLPSKRLFRVIDVTEGDTKTWCVYVPEDNLKSNLIKLKKFIDLYLEDLE